MARRCAAFFPARRRQEDVRRFSQHEVDILNLRDNDFRTMEAADLLNTHVETHLNLIAPQDTSAADYLRQEGKEAEDIWLITFDKLFSATPFAENISKMLRRLE